MADTADLIRRARELAKLAEKATPGPWYARPNPEWHRAPWRVDTRERLPEDRYDDGNVCLAGKHNALLIAAAPEMARLLGQLADELERLSSDWRDRCYQEMLAARGIDFPDDACPRCKGTGVRLYPDTTTWRGGVGGQIVTRDVCDKCWGSGDRNVKWADLRKLEAELARLKGSTFRPCEQCGRTVMSEDHP